MSMSGIEIDEEVGTIFQDMKLKSKYGWALFKIKDKKIVVLDVLDTDNHRSYDEFMVKVRESGEPRYILYDFNGLHPDGRELKKLVFIFWCLENSRIGDKMIYASTKDLVKKTFTGLGIEMQVNEDRDFYEEIKELVIRKS